MFCGSLATCSWEPMISYFHLFPNAWTLSWNSMKLSQMCRRRISPQKEISIWWKIYWTLSKKNNKQPPNAKNTLVISIIFHTFPYNVERFTSYCTVPLPFFRTCRRNPWSCRKRSRRSSWPKKRRLGVGQMFHSFRISESIRIESRPHWRSMNFLQLWDINTYKHVKTQGAFISE